MSALYSVDHLLALLAVAAFATSLVAGARYRSLSWTRHAARVLGAVLIADELSWWIYLAYEHDRLVLVQSLPLQLCDALVLVAAGALWLRLPLLIELTYFAGIAGSAQALLTPDLPANLPGFPFFQYYIATQYYIAHGGVVAAALFLVVGLGLQPRRGSVWLVAGVTAAFTVLVAAVDAVTGADYMYLRSKPPAPTALDLFGPWPWYLGGAAVVGLLSLLLLDAPFRLRLRRFPLRTEIRPIP